MLKKKKIYFFIMLCIVLNLLITGCDKEINDNEIQGISVDFNNILAYTTLLDDSFIYFSVEKETATYYRHYIKEGKTITLGTIENFYLNTKEVTLINDKLYFYTSIYDKNNVNDFSNTLFVINLYDNTIEKYEHKDNSLAGIPTHQYNGNIITLKNEVSNRVITTFLEIFDVESKEWEKENINVYNNDTNIGSGIYGLYGNEESLYVLNDQCYGDHGNVNSTLKIYNDNLEEIQSIKIDKSIREYIFNSRIIELAVFDEFVYIKNISNYAVIGKIVGDSIEPIVMERNLELSLNQTDSDTPFFYIRSTNKCYILDAETGDIVTIELQIGNNYSIMCILANKKNILLICNADDETDYMYYIKKEDIDNAYFPCTP